MNEQNAIKIEQGSQLPPRAIELLPDRGRSIKPQQLEINGPGVINWDSTVNRPVPEEEIEKFGFPLTNIPAVLRNRIRGYIGEGSKTLVLALLPLAGEKREVLKLSNDPRAIEEAVDYLRSLGKTSAKRYGPLVADYRKIDQKSAYLIEDYIGGKTLESLLATGYLGLMDIVDICYQITDLSTQLAKISSPDNVLSGYALVDLKLNAIKIVPDEKSEFLIKNVDWNVLATVGREEGIHKRWPYERLIYSSPYDGVGQFLRSVILSSFSPKDVIKLAATLEQSQYPKPSYPLPRYVIETIRNRGKQDTSQLKCTTSLPRGLAYILAKALSPDTTSLYPTFDELHRALAHYQTLLLSDPGEYDDLVIHPRLDPLGNLIKDKKKIKEELVLSEKGFIFLDKLSFYLSCREDFKEWTSQRRESSTDFPPYPRLTDQDVNLLLEYGADFYSADLTGRIGEYDKAVKYADRSFQRTGKFESYLLTSIAEAAKTNQQVSSHWPELMAFLTSFVDKPEKAVRLLEKKLTDQGITMEDFTQTFKLPLLDQAVKLVEGLKQENKDLTFWRKSFNNLFKNKPTHSLIFDLDVDKRIKELGRQAQKRWLTELVTSVVQNKTPPMVISQLSEVFDNRYLIEELEDDGFWMLDKSEISGLQAEITRLEPQDSLKDFAQVNEYINLFFPEKKRGRPTREMPKWWHYLKDLGPLDAEAVLEEAYDTSQQQPQILKNFFASLKEIKELNPQAHSPLVDFSTLLLELTEPTTRLWYFKLLMKTRPDLFKIIDQSEAFKQLIRSVTIEEENRIKKGETGWW